jgi:hypothetical protein
MSDESDGQAFELMAVLSHVRELLGDVAEAFGNGMTASMIGPRLTCHEAESLAELLRFGSYSQAADMILWCHSDGDDDPSDQHYQMEKPPGLLLEGDL